MHSVDNGFIFPQVLCVCLMMGLLAIPMIHRNFLEMQMTRSLHMADQQFYTVEAALHDAEQKIEVGEIVNCRVPQMQHYDYLQETGCTFVLGKNMAHYIVETWGHDPCAEDIKTHQRGIDYFRITAWASDQPLHLYTVLQTTSGQSSPTDTDVCIHAIHHVALGRQ